MTDAEFGVIEKAFGVTLDPWQRQFVSALLKRTRERPGEPLIVYTSLPRWRAKSLLCRPVAVSGDRKSGAVQ